MSKLCSLFPKELEPLVYMDDIIEELDNDEPYENGFDTFPSMDTNGDRNITLPQPNGNMGQLTVKVDPVRSGRKLHELFFYISVVLLQNAWNLDDSDDMELQTMAGMDKMVLKNGELHFFSFLLSENYFYG